MNLLENRLDVEATVSSPLSISIEVRGVATRVEAGCSKGMSLGHG